MRALGTARKAAWLVGVGAVVAFSGNTAAAPLALQDVPLFVATGAEPNVMIMLDNSGSMLNIVPDAPYDPNEPYTDCPAANQWDPAEQVDLEISSGSPRINGEVWGIGAGQRCFSTTADYMARLSTAAVSGGSLPAQYTGNYLNWYFDSTRTSATTPGCTTWSGGGKKPCTKTRLEIAKAAGVNLVESMPTAMRAGLSTYNNGNGGRLLEVVANLTDSKRTSLKTTINAMTASGNTPLAETLSDIGYYFSRGATSNLVLHPSAATPTSVSRTDLFNNGYSRSSSWGTGSNPIQYSCQKSFAVLLTDGRPQGDQHISSYLQDYDGDCNNATPECLSHDRKPDQEYESQGSDYLDDVAQALYEVDVRPDLSDSLGSKNNVATYVISFADDQAIDDPLMDDAARQGGGAKYTAGNETQLTTAFSTALASIVQRTASASSASVNSGSISSATRVYQAKFNSATWTGQLLSYPVNMDGSLVTSGAQVWDASDQLPAPDDRQIITVNSNGTPAKFRWTGTGTVLDTTRRAQLNDTSALLDYLRGDATNEPVSPTSYRQRNDASGPNKLGDIVSSAPLFVGAPPFRYRDSLEAQPYSAFATTHNSRRGMIYVGANDGMLHGFDASSGREVFAFIPSPVFANLPALAAKNYGHKFYVDGSPSMGDAFFGGAWHTVLVGGLNKGGRGIYALDITNPATLAAAEANPGNVVLWEFTSDDDADLGFTYSQPAIVKLQDGRWAAVFGNGYNSPAGKAVLYIVDISNGSVIAKLERTEIAPAGATWDNGLSTPAVVDVNGDRRVDYAYAGDLFGNMWKFDLSSSNSNSWSMSRLFTARQSNTAGAPIQPITVRPEVARGPRGSGLIVVFGTGKYLELTDRSSTQVQSFYGIIDRGSEVTDRSALLQQQITQQFGFDPDGNSGPLTTINARISTNTAIGNQPGWYIDLVPPSPAAAQGEKQVTNPVVRDGRIIFTTLVPNTDPCGAGGSSWLMELDLLSGARLGQAPFDTNNDGQFTDADRANPPSGGAAHVSGIQWPTAGILQSPGVIEGETTGGECVQHKYMPDSAGNIKQAKESCGPGGLGRQSWRQIR